MMEYREIGKTGMRASVVGLGAEHLDNRPYEEVKAVMDAALEQDINIVDIFMPGTPVRENIGKAIAGKRDKLLIQGHIGSVDLRQQYDRTRDLDACKKYFEELLRCLNTDYIDLGLMFFIDTEEDYKGVFETGYIDYVLDLKKQGKIRAVGFSSHNPDTAVKVIETGTVEMMMFSINLAFDMLPIEAYALDTLEKGLDKSALGGIAPERQRLYELCESKGVGITVMKTLGAGKLLSAEHTPFDRPLSVGQCIHYALTRPAVSSALIGCRTREEVLEAVKYCGLTDEERDYTGAVGSFRHNFQGKCVYCNHCLPCPSDIDIAAVNKYLDIAQLTPDNIPPSVAMHYKLLGQTGSDCIACGRCENKCPFQVPVVRNMQQAARLFGC